MKYFLILFIPIIYGSCVFNCKTYLRKEIKPLELKGIVKSKINSSIGCFGDISLLQNNEVIVLKDVCSCVRKEQGLWNYVIEGDSIYKRSGSITVEIWRNNSKTSFEYPCCSY